LKQQYLITWTDNSKNETAFVIQRSSSQTGPWSILATIPSDRLTTRPGTGQRASTDGTKDTFYYQVYAINVAGDTWDYSNLAFNQIPPGGRWPTLTLDSRGGANTPPSNNAIAAPSNLTASAAVKNKKTATVTLNWKDNAKFENVFLIQRAYNGAFTSGVVNSTIAGSALTSFSQNVACGMTLYYRVLVFNDTIQSE